MTPGRPPPLRPARRSRRSSRAVEPAAGRWPAWAPARSASPAPTGGATPPTSAGPPGPAPTTTAEREAYRRDGRRLVAALVAHLDAEPTTPRRASGPRPTRRELVDDLARRLAASGHEPDRGGRAVRGGPPAVPRRADRARPAAGARRRAPRGALRETRRACSTGCCSGSSRPTRTATPRDAAHEPRRRPARP